ncbi:MAG: DUF3108 domain-containing protein [Planctomycetota bacterium]|nr:DUF3108 domain-containing protein [Planctomycetota bacterium]
MKRTLLGITAISCVLLALSYGVIIAEEDSESPAPSASESQSPSVSPSASPSESPKVSLPPFEPFDHELEIGEKHVYEIAYRGFAAGTGAIEVVGRGLLPAPFYKVQMTAKSSKFVELLYPVKDTFISHIHGSKGYALQFERHMREGRNAKNFRDETIVYDYSKMKAFYNSKKDKGGKVKEYEKPLQSKVLDPLSAVMYLRALEPEVGKTYKFPMHSSDEDWVLKLKCVGLVGLRVTGVGKFNAWKLEPETKEDALFTSNGAMKMWIEKETKVVLRAEVDVPIGSIVVRMIRAENSPLEDVNRQEKRRRWIRPGTREIP